MPSYLDTKTYIKYCSCIPLPQSVIQTNSTYHISNLKTVLITFIKVLIKLSDKQTVLITYLQVLVITTDS